MDSAAAEAHVWLLAERQLRRAAVSPRYRWLDEDFREGGLPPEEEGILRVRAVLSALSKVGALSGAAAGRLMETAVAAAARGVNSELLMVTPYFIPSADEKQLLTDLRAHQVKVRVLTNSLQSAPELAAQAGYMKFRVPLLMQGIDLHEARSFLGSARGSGQTKRISSYGNYALHAKIIVFDRNRVFMGSMNFDQRSKRLNTEVGLIIDSPELAQQTALRFEGMVQPENAYSVELRDQRHLVWETQEGGKTVRYDREPARGEGQRLQVELLSFLPLDREL